MRIYLIPQMGSDRLSGQFGSKLIAGIKPSAFTKVGDDYDRSRAARPVRLVALL
jgi:ribosomal protein S19E (S16A)